MAALYPGPQAPPLPAQWLTQIHWSPHPVPSGDVYAKQTRDFLLEQFPTIYNAPLGWKTFPTATVQTALWARAICPKRPAQSHQQWFHLIWSTLRSHWRASCERTIAAIKQQGDAMAMSSANRAIRAKRRAHDALPVGHDTRLAKRRTFVAHTARLWLTQRTLLLHPEQPSAHTPPIRRLRRRPPRKPPDPTQPANPRSGAPA
ncbi:hypothetical protein LEN26_013517 [Aphanomyces euteiches]|nr:hypothetical protein AeMF1_017047 [Aphanomyces euteiches]KAH9111294.1 hypothetical protein LEN26_013517 [Aphanomyces euteiches]